MEEVIGVLECLYNAEYAKVVRVSMSHVSDDDENEMDEMMNVHRPDSSTMLDVRQYCELSDELNSLMDYLDFAGYKYVVFTRDNGLVIPNWPRYHD